MALAFSGPQTLQGPELLWDDRGRVEDSRLLAGSLGRLSLPLLPPLPLLQEHIILTFPTTKPFSFYLLPGGFSSSTSLFIQFWLRWKNREKTNSDLLWNLTNYGFFFFFSLNDVSFLLCKKRFFWWSHWCFPAFIVSFPDSPTPVCFGTRKSDVSVPTQSVPTAAPVLILCSCPQLVREQDRSRLMGLGCLWRLAWCMEESHETVVLLGIVAQRSNQVGLGVSFKTCIFFLSFF